MTDNKLPPDPGEFLDNIAKAMQKASQVLQNYSETRAESDNRTLEKVARVFSDITASYMQNPEKAVQAQMQLFQQQSKLWMNTMASFLGEEVEPVIQPDSSDRRFKDKDWNENRFFDFLKQSYLITSRWAGETIQNADDVSDTTKRKALFYSEQLNNALSPSNFAFTNPEVLRLTIENNGSNLVEGMEKLSRDFSDGRLNLRQTDLSVFEVGKNLAITPGKVIFQNKLIQLVQYAPTTTTVYKKPVLIIPPWINKYYILDLNPDKSFIKWAVDQGLTIFVISWVNPDESHKSIGFADYMKLGIIASLDAIEAATGEKSVNAIGYCIGGTLLASTLGVMAQAKDKRIASATFFTTQVDFTEAGDLLVFADEEQIAEVDSIMETTGYLEGTFMANAFNMMRSNDLIWSCMINNYLKAAEPMPFDLLFWNSDNTRMPAATHSFYLRECYLKNHLSQAKMQLDGIRVDLSKVKIPIYNLAAREDHIAPLPSVFKLGRFFGGKTRMVVSGSGHIAGVINPPQSGKYQYWTNEAPAVDLMEWLETAQEHQGSWWPDWKRWITRRSGKKVAPRIPGDKDLLPIEDAPGSYVLMTLG